MRARYVTQLVLLSAVWGISFLMMRIAVVSFPPPWIAMLRCALGAALLWTVLWAGGHRLPPRRMFGWLLLIALLNNAVPFTFFAWGERTVPSNIAAVLNATVPLWTLLFSMAVYRSRSGVRTIAGVLMSFAGVILVVAAQPGGGTGGVAVWNGGTLVIGLAAVSYAIATLLAKAKLKGLDPIGLATTQLSLATLLLVPVALAAGHPVALRPATCGAVAVLGFAGSGVAYLLYYRLLPNISATQLAAVTYLMPIWGVFWGFFAGEAIGVAGGCGVAITILGLVLMNMQGRGAVTVRRSAA